jgi:hypothetical protein
MVDLWVWDWTFSLSLKPSVSAWIGEIVLISNNQPKCDNFRQVGHSTAWVSMEEAVRMFLLVLAVKVAILVSYLVGRRDLFCFLCWVI